MKNFKAVTLLSGGPDSSTLAYWAKDNGYDQRGIFFDYGQAYAQSEMAGARAVADKLGIHLEMICVPELRKMLIGFIDYPHVMMGGSGGCGDPQALLGIAATYATIIKAETVLNATIKEDLSEFPGLDKFYSYFEKALQSMPHIGKLTIQAPFIEKTKSDVVKIGSKLGVPFELTRSCQESTVAHCGVCKRCKARNKAFTTAKVTDSTKYLKTPKP